EETRKEMRKVLREIQDGTFARNWIMENKAGRAHYKAIKRLEAEAGHEKVGEELRKMYNWEN
ncbi:MAG: ketol-acid reductoisomerase, partial [Oscillospiraceae bacterium]|nr:ketol-acid reductoisomerase [Oscillospiraceae bacterium]